MQRCLDMQAGGAVESGTVRCEMTKLDPGRATGTSLDHTDANGERLSQRCTTSKQWQRGVFTNRTGVPRNLGKLVRKPMMGHRKKYISKFSIRRNGETPACSEHMGESSRHAAKRRGRLGPRSSARNSAARPGRRDEERCGRPSDVFVSKESSRDSSSAVLDPATAGR